MNNTKSTVIYGINPLFEILKSQKRRILKIYFSDKRRGKGIDKIIHNAKIQGIEFETVNQKTFHKICPWDNNQGVAGIVSNKELISVEEMIDISFKKEPNPTLVLLDHIEDPGNLGSIIRSAEVLGIRGIIIPKNRAVDLTPVVSKSSAGALEHMLVSRVSNILNTIRLLKEKGFWIIGAKESSKNYCFSYDFKRPVALVLGAEGKAFRPLVEKNCHEVVSIPQLGIVNSLNVSCAAAILFYEILKQKHPFS